MHRDNTAERRQTGCCDNIWQLKHSNSMHKPTNVEHVLGTKYTQCNLHCKIWGLTVRTNRKVKSDPLTSTIKCYDFMSLHSTHAYKLPQAQKILRYRLCHQDYGLPEFQVGSLADRYKQFRGTYCHYHYLQDSPLVPAFQITQNTVMLILWWEPQISQ